MKSLGGNNLSNIFKKDKFTPVASKPLGGKKKNGPREVKSRKQFRAWGVCMCVGWGQQQGTGVFFVCFGFTVFRGLTLK